MISQRGYHGGHGGPRGPRGANETMGLWGGGQGDHGGQGRSISPREVEGAKGGQA